MSKQQKKQTHHSKPHGSGTYAERQQSYRQAMCQMMQDTAMQYMLDMLILTLNDPKAMGKDVFGRERIRRVVSVLHTNMEECWIVMDKTHNEAGAYRTRLDRKLMQILGEDDFVPFEQRYEWVKDVL